MEESAVQSAVNDIKLIKGVIEKSTGPIMQLSKTFIYLGYWFLAIGVFDVYFHFYLSQRLAISTLYIISYISATMSLPFLVWIFVSAFRTPLYGINRHIIKIWVWVFVFAFGGSVVINKIIALDPNFFQYLENFYIIRALQLLAYAFGFLCMSVFSKLKLPVLFALLYAATGLFCILPNHIILKILSFDVLKIFHSYNEMTGRISDSIGIMVAVTFLIMGYYLHQKKARSN